MSKPGPVSTIESVVTSSGFTPCPDVLVKAYSHTTALVWGKVWRYSQMSDGICRASILRIAEEMNIAPNTVAKHLEILEVDQYVKDLTPDVRNKPHEYMDTGKLVLKISLEMAEKGGTQNLSSRYAKFAHEETTTKGTGVKPNIYAMYHNNIGMITPMQADILRDAEKEYPEEWIIDAIGLAVRKNARNWAYCEKILKRWKADGKDDGKSKPEPTKNEALKKAGYDV